MYDLGAGGKKKAKGSDLIQMEIDQTGSAIDVTYTVFSDEGEVPISLSGEHGNGHFYALGMHPEGGPVFAVGQVKKSKIKGKGITTFDSAIFEFKFSVKAIREKF